MTDPIKSDIIGIEAYINLMLRLFFFIFKLKSVKVLSYIDRVQENPP